MSWILVIIGAAYAGVQYIPFTNEKACIEAKQFIEENGNRRTETKCIHND
jgi:hypothetical protein